jgi:hypothetical protein
MLFMCVLESVLSIDPYTLALSPLSLLSNIFVFQLSKSTPQNKWIEISFSRLQIEGLWTPNLCTHLCTGFSIFT